MSKVLIIGQAPPAVKQTYPYDTTMLYTWLNEIGITKEQAQDLFEFDAVYDKFPGFKEGGGHKTPTKEQMEDYWERALKEKVNKADKILILGNTAKDLFLGKGIFRNNMYFLMHPSKYNMKKYQENKEKVLSTLKKALCMQ